MATKFLSESGVATLWDKVKSYVNSLKRLSEYTSSLTTGTQIGSFTQSSGDSSKGTTTTASVPIYVPTVAVTQAQTAGTEIGSVSVGDLTTKLYGGIDWTKTSKTVTRNTTNTTGATFTCFASGPIVTLGGYVDIVKPITQWADITVATLPSDCIPDGAQSYVGIGFTEASDTDFFGPAHFSVTSSGTLQAAMHHNYTSTSTNSIRVWFTAQYIRSL